MIKRFSKIVGKETIDYELPSKDPIILNRASIVSINAVSGKIDIQKTDDIYIIDYHLKANLVVLSSISNEPFDYEELIEETLYYTEKKGLASNDVFYVEKDGIDIDEEVISLVITSLPIQLHKEGEEYPSGENFRVISEEDLEKEDEENASSPFDVLEDMID